MADTKQLALVLGATGGIGSEVARQLAASGWRVRAMHRNPQGLANRSDAFEWCQGDALVQSDVVSAAQGATLIVHAVNPPGYRHWSEWVLPMIDNTIAAARSTHARIVLPGTVYNFGPDSFPILHEHSAQHPTTRKGKIRVEVERRLAAAASDGVRSLIVRAGDFFGPSANSNWFSGALVQPGKPVLTVRYPGARGTGHQWAYLPDVARTIVRLLERDGQLPAFAVYHMRGHWDEDGTRMTEAIRRATGQKLKVSAFPWWALPLLSPFSVLFRELREMRYLWQQPIRMDNQRLLETLGDEPHTEWEEAVKTTLRSMRCI